MSDDRADTSREPGVSLAALRGAALALLVTLGALGLPARGLEPELLDLSLRSGAAALFFFASGWAIAPALISVFAAEGAGRGALRVLHRVWQLYWRYLGAIALSAAILAGVAGPEGRAEALSAFGLGGLVETPRETLLRLALLLEQPAAFAPMQAYGGALLLAAPLLVLGARAPMAAMGLSVGLYFAAQLLDPAPSQAAARPFDPLAWQVIFSAGFAFGAGWIRLPPLADARALWIAVGAMTLFSLAASALGVFAADPFAAEALARLRPWFLLLAAAVGAALFGLLRGAPALIAAPLERVGGQSLAALASVGPILALLQALFGPAPAFAPALASAALGLALLYAAARLSAWFMDPPWSGPPPRAAAPQPARRPL